MLGPLPAAANQPVHWLASAAAAATPGAGIADFCGCAEVVLELAFLPDPPSLALLLAPLLPARVPLLLALVPPLLMPPCRRLAAMLLSTTDPLPFMVMAALPAPPRAARTCVQVCEYVCVLLCACMHLSALGMLVGMQRHARSHQSICPLHTNAPARFRIAGAAPRAPHFPAPHASFPPSPTSASLPLGVVVVVADTAAAVTGSAMADTSAGTLPLLSAAHAHTNTTYTHS